MLARSIFPKGFPAGENYPGVYLSHTELQIILGLVSGKPLNQLATDLNIARRTVDYHCCNMMRLLEFDDLKALIAYMQGHSLLGGVVN